MPFKNRHPLYYVWRNMIHRCTSPKNSYFANYGGRGIGVCAPWLDSFNAFLADMESSWAPGLTLDRIDTNSGYSRGNCRWATCVEQQRNRTSNKLNAEQADLIRHEALLGHRNKAALARKYGVSRAMVRKIVSGAAWN